MARRRWSDLSPTTQRLILVGGAIEGTLKLMALADLRRRPREAVRGSKLLWALAISFVNAFGGVPLLYFAIGRRSAEAVAAD